MVTAAKKYIDENSMESRGQLDMLTQTLEPIADKRDLIQAIELLSDRAILQAKGYVERLREEEKEREIDEEIAALEAKYGTTPNAETIAAIEEGRARRGKRASSIKEFFEAIHHADN